MPYVAQGSEATAERPTSHYGSRLVLRRAYSALAENLDIETLSSRKEWLAIRSSRERSDCRAEYGGADGDRTRDLLSARQALIPAELQPHRKGTTMIGGPVLGVNKAGLQDKTLPVVSVSGHQPISVQDIRTPGHDAPAQPTLPCRSPGSWHIGTACAGLRHSWGSRLTRYRGNALLHCRYPVLQHSNTPVLRRCGAQVRSFSMTATYRPDSSSNTREMCQPVPSRISCISCFETSR